MGLPSIYASDDNKIPVSNRRHGSSISRSSASIKDIAHTSDCGKYKVSDIDNLILVEPKLARTGGEDYPMLEMQNEDEILSVSNMLSQRRSSHSEPSESCVSREALDLEIPMMVPTRIKSVFVVDTNFLISHLATLEDLRRLAPSFHHQIIIPNTVIHELDGLKNSSRAVQLDDVTEEIGSLARRANDWIYGNLANGDSGVMGQKLRQMINPNCAKDDAILDCCLFFKENLSCFVILLSNDKNLCMKALTEGLPTVSFRKGMTAQLIASVTHNENMSLFGPGIEVDEQETPAQEPRRLNFTEVSLQIFSQVTAAMVKATYQVLEDEYGEDVNLIDFQPGTISDLKAVTKCIDKLWVSVFGDYFKRSRIQKSDWKNIPACLTTLPTCIQSLKKFVSFWEEILHLLYLKGYQKDNETLQEDVLRWTRSISEFQ